MRYLKISKTQLRITMLSTPAEATDLEMQQHFRVEGALLARPSIFGEAKERMSKFEVRSIH